MSVDWPATLVHAKANAGEWVLAGELVPRSALRTAQRRSNLALRSLEHPLEAKMTPLVGDPPRGNLYVRYLGPVEKEPGEAPFFRTVVVSSSLKERLRVAADKNGTTMTKLVEVACRRIIRRGAIEQPSDPVTTLNISVDRGVWSRALARSQRDGFVLAEAIRDELERMTPKG